MDKYKQKFSENENVMNKKEQRIHDFLKKSLDKLQNKITFVGYLETLISSYADYMVNIDFEEKIYNSMKFYFNEKNYSENKNVIDLIIKQIKKYGRTVTLEKNVSFEDSAGIKYTCNVISINTGNDLNNFDYNIGHPFR